ncbi:hypothetical protein SNE40_020530 [Patella caerulea]|uniref:Uncharacterized protein n=1 Tax=Patella caerulea TaxID=87958 RepID=A0AAN8G7Q1_PATCE
MFSFHKPKIYRSINGCCICRAKSSSSRFTDSIKYQDQFEKCFRIRDSRHGEICNACVLLVKRWKKLPEGTSRHWHHVVDARAGPGTKSSHKLKNQKSPLKFKKHKKKIKKESQFQNIPSPTFSDASGNENSIDGTETFRQKRSQSLSDESDTEDVPAREVSRPRKRSGSQYVSSFLDLTYWKKTQVCCGIIFKGLNGEVLLDPKLLRPCLSCNPDKNKHSTEMHRSQSVETESNASSSGYNEHDNDNGDDNDFDSKPQDEDSSSAYSLDNLPTMPDNKFSTGFTTHALAMEC